MLSRAAYGTSELRKPLVLQTPQPLSCAHIVTYAVVLGRLLLFTDCLLSPCSALKAPGPSLPLVTGEWETVYFRGVWVTGSSAGGGRNFLSHWRNPRFPVAVGDHVAGTPGVNVQVTLRQNHPDTDLQPIGFHLYTVRGFLNMFVCFYGCDMRLVCHFL